MNKLIPSVSLATILLSAVFLIALQIKPLGWMLLLIGGSITLLSPNKKFQKDISLICVSLFFIGIAPISTDIGIVHSILMGVPLISAILVPYLISRYVYKDHAIRFRFHHEKRWYKTEIIYVLSVSLMMYLIWPFVFRQTGTFHNWTIETNTGYLIRLLLAIFCLGAWDELIFISTISGILRKHFTFIVANFAQSILCTSFLYALGFREWAFLFVFPFVFAQGMLFKKTNSLFYPLCTHLAVDTILFLALVDAYYPNLIPVFLIK